MDCPKRDYDMGIGAADFWAIRGYLTPQARFYKISYFEIGRIS